MYYFRKFKRITVLLGISAVICILAYVVAQFFVMPWENSKLPALENPRLVISKENRELRVFDGVNIVKTYPISMGSSPTGDKEIEGDGRTPEGEFYVFTKNDKSRFFLSLGISYPGVEDAVRGLKSGIISQTEHDQIIEAIRNKQMPLQKTKLGGEIYIHGGGTIADWTDGCIALRNEEMQELYDAVSVGTIVIIEP